MSLHSSRSFSRPIAAGLLAGLCLLAGPSLAQQAQAPAAPAPNLDVPYVPTPQDVVDRMLEMAQVKKDDYLIDLGSGDGRIPVTAAKKYGVRAYGVDLNPVRVKEAKENAEKNGVSDKVTFEEKNLFDTKIGEADVLTMYLFNSVNLKLRPRVLEELEPGTRVVSHAFNMGEWEPDQSDAVGSREVFLWIVPAKVDGRWTVKDGEGKEFTLDLKQQFQKITGTAEMNGRSVPLKDAKLRGADISFTVDVGEGQPKTFSGRVKDNAMTASGTPAAKGGQGTPAKGWSASRSS